jgi:hypothetical protein
MFFSGFYCKLNASSNTPDDHITGGPCHPGKYCPAGSVEGKDCPKGMLNYIIPISIRCQSGLVLCAGLLVAGVLSGGAPTFFGLPELCCMLSPSSG